jgi:putative membrane protein
MRSLARFALVPVAAAGLVALAAAPALAAPSSQDTTWMQAAHQSNLAEIAAGNAAQKSASSAQVKQLGAMFVQMHTQLDQQLTQAAQQLGVQLPSSPSATQQQQLAAVQQKSGSAFDSAWVSQQIGSHSTTLAATQRELSSGSDSTVLQLAKTATPVVQQHLTQLRSAAGQLGIPASVNGGTGGQAAGSGNEVTGWALAGAGSLAVLAGAAAVVRRRRAPVA